VVPIVGALFGVGVGVGVGVGGCVVIAVLVLVVVVVVVIAVAISYLLVLQDAHIEHLVGLITQQPKEGDSRALTVSAGAGSEDCTSPAYFSRHAAAIVTERSPQSDTEARAWTRS
jgi:hypothetical protein